jgi:glycerophosphoryl diester phosphodiesterase
MRAMPLLYAHRGAAAELPENTLPAFARALALGADALETDAHLTADGHVVLSHDATGARMANVRRAIAESTLAEVQSWDVGVGHVSKGGARAHAGRGFRVPTLEEALRAFPHTPFNVDAKSRHPDMVPRLVELVHRLGAEGRTLIASFDVRTLRRVRRLGYRGPTGLAQAEAVRLLFLPLRVLRLVPLQGVAAQLPYRLRFMDLGTPRVVARCHALGLAVHYWTVNDPVLARRLLDAGADAIMTDDPAAIAPVFAERALEHARRHA